MIFEKNGDYAFVDVCSNWCRFLHQASRQLCGTDDYTKAFASGMWHCHESHWTDAARVSLETGESIDIECRGGIRIFATPILSGGELVGSLTLGYGEIPRDLGKLKTIAGRYDCSIEKLRRHVHSCKLNTNFLISLVRANSTLLASLLGSIVERKRIEEMLRESNEKFRSLFENVEDAIVWVHPATGFIINCNKAAEAFLERTRTEIVGSSQTTIHPPGKVEYYTKLFKETVEQGQGMFDVEVVTKSNEIRRCHVTASRLLIRGEPIIQETFQDITESEKLRDELRLYDETLDELVEDRLQKSKGPERVAAISDVAGVVSYDLRNYLETIADTIGSAKRRLESLPRERRTYAKKFGAWDILFKIEEQADHLNSIAAALQDYAKPKKPTWELTSLSELATQALSAVEIPEAVDFKMQIEKSFPKVVVDREMMKRVFIYLYMNAIEAMPSGGVITIAASKKKGSVSVTVRDTGVGVPKETLGKVFEPLFTTKPRGTGFGLPACRRLLENQDGSIEVESDLGKGTTVTMRIPVRRGIK